MRPAILRAGFDELVREWLRLAEQAKWIENAGAGSASRFYSVA